MIAIVDYGMGNLRSVEKALQACGAETVLTNEGRVISRSKGVVLPGVGAFSRGMDNLERLNIISSISEAVDSGRPLLGICLGLQLLFSESEEHGFHKGLDIIKGRVRRFRVDVKVPHMGWNQVKRSPGYNPAVSRIQPSGPTLDILNGIPDESYFYFVHSYYVEPEDKNVVLATTEYGVEFASVVKSDNIMGLQFHPEKSSDMGLEILRNFCSYVC